MLDELQERCRVRHKAFFITMLCITSLMIVGCGEDEANELITEEPTVKETITDEKTKKTEEWVQYNFDTNTTLSST